MKKARVLIVDYGLGNLRSVAGAVERVGHEAVISRDLAEAKRADKIILPGVGAFGDGMENLKKMDWLPVLAEEAIAKKKPFLGICLGAQLLAKSSDEFGMHEGIGWIDAEVRRFALADKSLRVPHVGWNELRQCGDHPLFADVPGDSLFYYVHSYFIGPVRSEGRAIGVCDYGGEFTAAFARENICGTQFHPEKSQAHGLKLLQNFLERVE